MVKRFLSSLNLSKVIAPLVIIGLLVFLIFIMVNTLSP